jgi:hypothetical protein
MLYLALARSGKTEVAKKISLLSDAYFLFDGNRLVKASQAGQNLLGLAKEGGSDWAQFWAQFQPRFAQMPDEVPDPKTQHNIILASPDGASLRLQSAGKYLRGTLHEATDQATGETESFAQHKLFLAQHRVDYLHDICRSIPYPIWQTSLEKSSSGQINPTKIYRLPLIG